MMYLVEAVTEGVIESRHFETQDGALGYAHSVVAQGRHARVLELGHSARVTYSAGWVGGRLKLLEVS